LKKRSTIAIFSLVRNPLQLKYLVLAALVACSHNPPPQHEVKAPPPTAPLPTSGLSGQQVILLPLTLLAAEDSLHWEGALRDRRQSLSRADSIVGDLLRARAPEVSWVFPDAIRRAARRAPGIAPDPDQLGTAILRAEKLPAVPDPLRSQLRTLAALAGSGGGRFAMVPAALIYRRTPVVSAAKNGGAAKAPAPPERRGGGTAELVLVLADVRTGQIDWRTVARGDGDDPWSALTRAVKGLTPGLP
jgi:hypothetical protein